MKNKIKNLTIVLVLILISFYLCGCTTHNKKYDINYEKLYHGYLYNDSDYYIHYIMYNETEKEIPMHMGVLYPLGWHCELGAELKEVTNNTALPWVHSIWIPIGKYEIFIGANNNPYRDPEEEEWSKSRMELDKEHAYMAPGPFIWFIQIP